MTPTTRPEPGTTGTIAESTTRTGRHTVRLSQISDNTGTLYVVRLFAAGRSAGPVAQLSFATETAARHAANGAWLTDTLR